MLSAAGHEAMLQTFIAYYKPIVAIGYLLMLGGLLTFYFAYTLTLDIIFPKYCTDEWRVPREPTDVYDADQKVMILWEQSPRFLSGCPEPYNGYCPR